MNDRSFFLALLAVAIEESKNGHWAEFVQWLNRHAAESSWTDIVVDANFDALRRWTSGRSAS